MSRIRRKWNLELEDRSSAPSTALRFLLLTQSRRSQKERDELLFSQIAIIILGLFLVVMGFLEVNPLTGGLGALVAIFAAYTLYKLMTGK